MKKAKLFLGVLFTLIAAAATAQTVTVKGSVKDASTGEGIPFASVMVKGTMTGASSDADGAYTINAPQSGTLVFSAVGYKTKEAAVAGSTINVELEPDTQYIDETIVVAFGTATRESFTGAATVVKSDDLAKHTTSNVANSLVGSVAGLQIRGGSGAPGASQGSISIRGISSLYAETDPLVIVDGAPYSASLTNIPQSDIESITVLKDAASAALYGARGAAGVILITTKKGNSSKAVVNVDMKWGFNSRAIQDYDVIKDPGEFYEAYYSQLYNMYIDRGYSVAEANNQANTKLISDLKYNVYTVPDGQNLIGTNGKLNPNATLGRKYTSSKGTDYWLQPDDWTKAAYNNAFRHEYNVSMTAGTNNAHFYASLGYLNEDGIIEYSGFERITARLKADYQAKKWLKIGANVSYTHSKTNSNPNLSNSELGSTNLMYYTSNIAPIYPIYIRVLDENGNPTIKTDQYGNPAYDFGVSNENTGYFGLTRTFLSTGNPLGSNRYNKVESLGNQMNGTFTLDVNFTPWLKLNVTSNVIWGSSVGSSYQNSLYGPKVGVNGEITKSNTNTLRTNNSQTLAFNKDFGQHNVNVLLGHEYYWIQTKSLAAVANGGFAPSVQEINAFANKYDSSSSTTGYNVEGIFASAGYNYAEKYFVSASYRRDASSRFAKAHRWGNFWSAGAAWLISKESFMSSADAVDMLKLKFSIGQQGNDNIRDWAYTNLYSLSPNASNTGMSPSFARMGNEDITWETTTNLNVGVEASLFKGRLNASVDFYNKKTTNLLFWLSVPEASAGTRGYYGNIGDIMNTGVEVVLSGSVIRTKDIQWNINLNMSHNTTKILKLPESKVADNGGFTESSMWYKVGGPLYNGFYREWGIDENGEVFYYQDSDLHDVENDTWNTSKPGTKRDVKTYDPNTASKYEQGSMLPKLTGGFSTEFTWKSLDISASFDYQIGGKIYDNRYASLMSPSGNSATGNTFHKDVWKSWTAEKPSTETPRFQYDDLYTVSASTRFLTSASYLNFQSFTVGYTLPKFWKEISKMRIYVSGENLCFWSVRKGLDPRYSFSSTSSINTYAPVRSISGGIQITF